MTLESLLEFCREPSLMQDLYINYDCDVHCTNLFESIIVTLCQRSQPSPLSSSSSPPQTSPLYSSSIHQLAFQGVLAVLHSVANRVRQVSSTLPTAQESVVLPEVGSNLDEKDNVEEQVDAWCDQCEDVLPFSSRISSSPTSFTSTLSPPPSRTVSRELGFDQGQGDALTLASTAEVLRARRRKKEQLRRVAGLFNEKPLKDDWLALAMELGFIKEKSLNITQVASENVRPEGLSADAISVANFLKNTPLLGKIQVSFASLVQSSLSYFLVSHHYTKGGRIS